MPRIRWFARLRPDDPSADSREEVLTLVIVCVIGAALWWHVTLNLQAKLAYAGFSPTYFVSALKNPEWFAGNYPSGAEQFLKSVPMLSYIVADRLGIPIVATMKAMIALEIVLLIAAAVWAVRQLYPEAGGAVILLVGLSLIAGRLADPDFARWGHPHYAWSCNFANAGMIVGIVAALRSRLTLAAVALAFTVSAHLTLGVFATTFAGVAVLTAWRHNCYPRAKL